QSFACPFRVGDVEMQRRGAASGPRNLLHQLLRGVDTGPGMHIHVMTITRQAAAYRGADPAAAARDQRPLDRLIHDGSAASSSLHSKYDAGAAAQELAPAARNAEFVQCAALIAGQALG